MNSSLLDQIFQNCLGEWWKRPCLLPGKSVNRSVVCDVGMAGALSEHSCLQFGFLLRCWSLSERPCPFESKRVNLPDTKYRSRSIYVVLSLWRLSRDAKCSFLLQNVLKSMDLNANPNLIFAQLV